METGNIIQIIDEEHHWFPCLLVVNEIKSFGVMATLQYLIMIVIKLMEMRL